MSTASVADIERAIRNVPDFPKPGIQFKDITPVLGDPRLFRSAIEHLVGDLGHQRIQKVVGIDARGFILGAAAAVTLGAGFVPVRKKGKLPYQTHEKSYDLEYGSSTVAIHTDAIRRGERVLLVDDLLATGGTAGAAVALLEHLGAELAGIHFLVELGFLNGRERLGGYRIRSLIQY